MVHDGPKPIWLGSRLSEGPYFPIGVISAPVIFGEVLSVPLLLTGMLNGNARGFSSVAAPSYWNAHPLEACLVPLVLASPHKLLKLLKQAYGHHSKHITEIVISSVCF